MTSKLLRRLFAAAAFGMAVFPVASPAPGLPSSVSICGLTTLDGTVIENPANLGTLKCGPGMKLITREDLGVTAKATRASIRDALASFVTFSDFQLVDEESPLRAEFLDKCDVPGIENRFRAAFRTQETLLPELINAQIATANAIARGPVTSRNFDFGLQLGDAADNQQSNEVRWFMTLLDGSDGPDGSVKLVNPDSGSDGYEGIQGRDPATGTTSRLRSTVNGVSLRDLANEPFYAPGLRRPDGSRLPWYSVIGSHDVKTQGTMPNNAAWKAFANAFVTGDIKIADMAPDQQQRVCADPTLLSDPAFWQEVALTPGTTKLITADANRRLLDRDGWVAEHLPRAKATALDAQATGSYGLPAGHGFLTPDGKDNRCKNASGAPLGRACYSFDFMSSPSGLPIHFIALDTTADEGLGNGNLTQDEYDWLTRDLIAHSRSYTDEDGSAKADPSAKNSIIVVLSHHAEKDTNNAETIEPRYDGSDLEALFHRFPNMVLHLNGQTHQNKVWAHKAPTGAGGYWEVNTGSVADWPHESRTIELVDNHDGTISIFGVNFSAAVPADPRSIGWSQDATPETKLRPHVAASDREALKRDLNENWLASAAREIGFNDPQSGHASPYGENLPQDRNVELLVKNPFGVTPAVKPVRIEKPPSAPPTGFPFPRFPGFPFPTPQFPAPPFGQPSQPTFPNGGQGFGATQPGIGVPAKSYGPYVPTGEMLLLFSALLGGAWIYRARIHSWMLNDKTRP